MDLNYTPEERAFSDEVRAFLAEKLPKDVAAKEKNHKRLTKDDHLRWMGVLSERGWLGVNWPVEYGGPGWDPVQRHIFDEECTAAGGPRILSFGVFMVAHVIMKFGNQAQKDYYLPRILDLSDWWCQGYSEPGAGSDLASLKTSEVRDGDHYVVNGQKPWTTLGQHANKIFCLVRTDPKAPKPQQGISFLLIDMDTPGITVRPIILLDGEHEVNEVFFDDVRVPVENRVGEENQGWTYAKYLLTHERTNIAGVGLSKEAMRHLKVIAGDKIKSGKPLIEDPVFRAKMARVEIDLMALEMTQMRVLAAAQEGAAPGAESSILKIRGTQIRQAITDLSRRALGPHALPFQSDALDEGFNGETLGPDYANPVAANYFNIRKQSIYGGSNEIQKNIIAKMNLGL